MKRFYGFVIMSALLMFSSAGFASHAPPNQKANAFYDINFDLPGADISADNGCDWLKIAAILPVDFQICTVAAQNPNEGLQAYGWYKDKRSRLFMCRNNC